MREESPVDLRGKAEPVHTGHRIGNLRLVGDAYHLRCDPKRADAAVRVAMDLVPSLKPAAGIDAAAFGERTAQRLADLEFALKEYGSSPQPDRR